MADCKMIFTFSAHFLPRGRKNPRRGAKAVAKCRCVRYNRIRGSRRSARMITVSAAACGAAVTLYEKNPFCGKKLRITGKGRCNVCNDCDVNTVIEHVQSGNPRFLYAALNAFPPADVKAFFEENGVPLKTERGNRVFPVSDKAADIAEALRRYTWSTPQPRLSAFPTRLSARRCSRWLPPTSRPQAKATH